MPIPTMQPPSAPRAARRLAALSLLLAGVLAGCVAADDDDLDGGGEDLGADPSDLARVTDDTPDLGAIDPGVATPEADVAAACPPVSGTIAARSIVVTDVVGDPALRDKFSFARAMARLRATGGGTPADSTLVLWQRWMRTFAAGPAGCDAPAIDPDGYGLVCPRAPEAGLAAVSPFAGASLLEPVGLFNRFDLAPSNGANCGEYRIVYARTNQAAGRFFVILEAALPNPNPAAGIAGCLPIARFWQGLSADPSRASRAAKLEKFYFTGGAVAGVPPVVSAAHYGLSASGAPTAAGQIRVNSFMGFAEWHLREFKLRRACTTAGDPATCRLTIDHVRVKANPADELFRAGHARSAAFQAQFLTQLGAGRLGATSLTGIKLGTSNAFNEFESSAQATDVLYNSQASAAFRTQVGNALAAAGSSLTVRNVLDRATTQTCAGCHAISPGTPLGGGLTWPGSLGFVHISETRALSPALTRVFIPRRTAVLESYINRQCAGGATTRSSEPIATTTVGGGLVGAPN